MHKPSWFYWIIAVVAVLWGLFGAFDFWMTSTGNEMYLKDFPPEMIAWIKGFPAWRTGLWAVSVGAGALGGVLMLAEGIIVANLLRDLVRSVGRAELGRGAGPRGRGAPNRAQKRLDLNWK